MIGTTFTPLGPAPLDSRALPDFFDAPRLAGGMAVRGALMKARDATGSYLAAPRLEHDGTVYATHTGPWADWQFAAVQDADIVAAWLVANDVDEQTSALILDAQSHCDVWIYGSEEPAPALDPERITIIFGLPRSAAIAEVGG